MNLTHLSKFMSLVLRHRAPAFGLAPDGEGFVPLDALVAVVEKNAPLRAGREEILRVVEMGQPRRYEIKDGLIRATYGHSKSQKLGAAVAYPAVEPPSLLYHGTQPEALAAIRQQGLSAMHRQYVHLSTTVERAQDVSRRRTKAPVLVIIQAQAAHAAGIEFYSPEPKHYLAKRIPPEFIVFPKRETQLPEAILDSLQRALEEDLGAGDATTNSIVPTGARMSGRIIAKQAGIIAGLDVARETFLRLDQRVTFEALVAEGTWVENRQEIARVSGPARALLTGERTALNFLGRMSGIATLTRRCVEAVSGTRAIILDTRKTAPGLRAADKLAVLRGGGQNHRVGLYDMILIKDNHIDFAGSLTEAVRRARAAQTGLDIEVEARTLDDVREALALGIERILLDNMSLEMMREAVALTAGRAKLEASGNVSLDTVRAMAETGVDFISSGALTHSAKVFDVSLDWTEDGRR